MRALLKPYAQRAAGVGIFTPGTDLMWLFDQKQLLVSTVPPELADQPDGKLPDVIHSLVDDQRLKDFFMNERVLNAAGGEWALRDWLKRIMTCQWTRSDDKYHTKEMDTLKYGHSGVRLCWHHENKFREHILDELDRLADRNRAEFIIVSAVRELKLSEGHQLSFYDLCWWATLRGLVDLMPYDAARHALRWQPEKPIKSVGRESDIVPEAHPVQVLKERVEPVKAVIHVAIDPETPESFMLRPKRRRWENAKYTQWVKRQPCCGCGNQADDPHHITGNGFGGMGTKAHDMFVIPLCRQCHDRLHANTAEWEEENGSQLLLAMRTMDSALAMGVIATGKAK